MATLDLQVKISQAIVAHELGDDVNALLYLQSAEMILAALPQISHGGNQINFQNQLTQIRKAITSARNAKLGIQHIPVTMLEGGHDDE